MSTPSGTMYAIGIEGSTLVKIGCTQRPVMQRLRALQLAHPSPLVLLASVAVVGNVWQIEQQIHRRLTAHHQRGEWFNMSLDAHTFTALVEEAGAVLVSSPTEEDMMVSLGKELRKARIDKSLSQQELSALTGLSQKHLSALECDQMMPKWPTVVALALALDLDLNALAWNWSRLTQEMAHV